MITRRKSAFGGDFSAPMLSWQQFQMIFLDTVNLTSNWRSKLPHFAQQSTRVFEANILATELFSFYQDDAFPTEFVSHTAAYI